MGRHRNSGLDEKPKKGSLLAPSPSCSIQKGIIPPCPFREIQELFEGSLHEIFRLQNNRTQNKIFILTDERNDFNPDLAEFDVVVQVKTIPGLKLGSIFPIIEQNPYFGKGTIWVIMGGIHDLIESKPLQECLDFDCHTQPTTLELSPKICDRSFLIKESLELNWNILRKTENDIALFSDIIPVRINTYNDFVLENRSCLSNHKATPIIISSRPYDVYTKSVTLFNKFAKYRAATLGYTPWNLAESESVKKVPLSNLLQINGFDLLPIAIKERANRVELLCQELLATSSLKLEERERAILIQGLNWTVTEQSLMSYFEVYGQIERTRIRYRSLEKEQKMTYGYILYTSNASPAFALMKGSQFVIDGVTILASRFIQHEIQSPKPKKKGRKRPIGDFSNWETAEECLKQQAPSAVSIKPEELTIKEESSLVSDRP